jgi:hypothetical protein
MAKSTVGGGPSATEHEMQDPPIVFTRPELGFVDRPLVKEATPSVGTDSSQSSKSESSPENSNTQHPHNPAHTTENPSEAPEQETDSTAPTTDTDGQRKPTQRSSRPRKAVASALLTE